MARKKDSSGPRDPIVQDTASYGKHSKGTESYKSGSDQGGGSDASGSIPQLKRSTPKVGIYHSEGQNRGGQATKNYDSSVVHGDPHKFDKNIGHGSGGGKGDVD